MNPSLTPVILGCMVLGANASAIPDSSGEAIIGKPINLSLNISDEKPAAVDLLPKASGAPANDLITYTSTVEREIPDGSTSGLIDIIRVPKIPNEVITKVSINLSLDVPDGKTGFTGDLFAYVQHGDNQSVLLNRPGRGSVGNAGYDDNISLSITLIDGAPNGDIHNYRMRLNGDDTVPLSFALTGIWEPDGRATNPDSVLLTDSRTALLGGFEGGDPSGEWTILFSDLSGGGELRFKQWSLTLQTALVPEPSTWALITTFGIVILFKPRGAACNSA